MHSVPARQAPPAIPTDERGYTLQTLIITAVVALLAVAAGVVVVAITRNAQQDLEGVTSKTDGPCMPWEIHNVELAAAGAGGGQEAHYERIHERDMLRTSKVQGQPGAGGVTSSAPGCLAPCYLTLNDFFDYTLDMAMFEAGELAAWAQRQPNPDLHALPLETRNGPVGEGDLKFDTSNRPPDNQYAAGQLVSSYREGGVEVRVGVAYEYWPQDVWRRADIITDTAKDIQPLSNVKQIMNLPNVDTIWNSDNIGFDGIGELLLVPLGWTVPPVHRDGRVAIRVAASGDACEIYDKHTDEILASSRGV